MDGMKRIEQKGEAGEHDDPERSSLLPFAPRGQGCGSKHGEAQELVVAVRPVCQCKQEQYSGGDLNLAPVEGTSEPIQEKPVLLDQIFL